MKHNKWLGVLVMGFCVLTSTAFAITADDATKVHPTKALMHDIIKVDADQLAKYCHFDRQIVELPKDKNNHQYYLCVSIGEVRSTVK